MDCKNCDKECGKHPEYLDKLGFTKEQVDSMLKSLIKTISNAFENDEPLEKTIKDIHELLHVDDNMKLFASTLVLKYIAQVILEKQAMNDILHALKDKESPGAVH